jgi:hypothetical protein
MLLYIHLQANIYKRIIEFFRTDIKKVLQFTHDGVHVQCPVSASSRIPQPFSTRVNAIQFKFKCVHPGVNMRKILYGLVPSKTQLVII